MLVVCPECKDEIGKREHCLRCWGMGESPLTYEEMAKTLHEALYIIAELEARLENFERDTNSKG